MTQLAPFLVVLGRLNVRDGRVKPKPPIRQAHLRTGPAATVVVLPGRTTPEGPDESGREASLTRTARALTIGDDGYGPVQTSW